MSHARLARLVLLVCLFFAALAASLISVPESGPSGAAILDATPSSRFASDVEAVAHVDAAVTPAAVPTATPPPQVTVFWLFAHPDDESLAAGAAIQASQAAGRRNVLVVFSSGENTAVRTQLGLTRAQTIASREAETTDSMSFVGVTDIRFLNIPDGQVTIAAVRGVIDDILAKEPGPVWFRGHSPYDDYLGLACGHVDHCAVATALLQEWREGRITDLLFYRISQLFGMAATGDCHQLTPAERATKQRMRQAYAYNNWAQGRYGIGARSVAAAWAATATLPECTDVPR